MTTRQPLAKQEAAARYQAAVENLETALRHMQRDSYAKAAEILRNLMAGPVHEVADRARIHLCHCQRRLNPPAYAPKSAEDFYNLGVFELNSHALELAIEHLGRAARMKPAQEHIHYALAAAHALRGDADAALGAFKQGHRPPARESLSGSVRSRFCVAGRRSSFPATAERAPFRGLRAKTSLLFRLAGRCPDYPMRIVAIGGGTGLSTLLRGFKLHVAGAGRSAPLQPTISRLTAVVTVTDEGGSSGRLRREFRIPPPGDIRNCLVALAEDEKLFTKLFNFRFSSRGGLGGHSFGNLFLAALTNLTRDFARSVHLCSDILAICGEIFPSTLADVRLKARLRDGQTLYGESRISKTRVPIRRLSIVPARCRPLPETLAAIEQADLITLGPGSLYTSLIPNLLVQGISEHIARAQALKVYVCNLMTQPGESLHYTAAQHLRAIARHGGGNLFDRIVLNTQALPRALARRYATEQAEPVVNGLEEIRALGVEPLLAELLVQEDRVARHDSRRLVQLLLDLAARQGEPSATSLEGGGLPPPFPGHA